MRLKIASAVNLFGLLVALGFAAVIGTSVMALSQLKVGGPVYHQIVLAKDLVADILPPPEFGLGNTSDCVDGIANVNGELVLMLNLRQMLAPD